MGVATYRAWLQQVAGGAEHHHVGEVVTEAQNPVGAGLRGVWPRMWAWSQVGMAHLEGAWLQGEGRGPNFGGKF